MTARLEADLAARVRGGVSFGAGARALYSQDASHYRQAPLGVVVPLDEEDVVAALDVCREHRAAVLPRGGGTSLAGQGCNAAVVIDLSRHLDRIIALDPASRTARVQPGVVLDRLREAAATHGLTFGPDPSTHGWCTLGGMIGNNACGVHSVLAGRTSDNVERLDVVTGAGHRMSVGPLSEEELDAVCREEAPRGAVHRELRALRDRHVERIRAGFPVLPRRVSGFNLEELLPERGFHVARALTGTEGTCVTILEATVRLVRSPPERVLCLLGYADLAAAADAVPRLMAQGPTGLEGTDHGLIDNMRAKGLEAEGLGLLPEGRAWLLVELGGDTREEARGRAEALLAAVRAGGGAPDTRLVEDPRKAAQVWRAREAAVGASARLADGTDTWGGWEDAAVPPERLGGYLRGFHALLGEHGLRAVLYGHFGQGCVHARIDFDLVTREGITRYRRFVEAAADLVAAHGGSLSGEHGDGRARGELLPRMFGDELVEAFKRFKAVWDPEGRMNPGRVVLPERLDGDLRLGAGYQLPRHQTHFHYRSDEGSFARAVARCVGVGKCRRTGAEGTMCPSFMVTREERHGTRGRARLLFEMSEGRMPGGFANDDVKEALDLCLSCKACKRECPAGVDVATYKAEFLAHHYETRRRPLRAHLFGRVDLWARIGSRLPRLANALARAPGASWLLEKAGGIARQRSLPRLAPRPFVRAHGRRTSGPEGAPRVLLWPDTFTNHFHAGAAHAAVSVLHAAGFAVELPDRALCCGRPLYDFGMLARARRQLLRVLDAVDPRLDGVAAVVVLEPSCLSVFRDELRDLLPDDPRAERLAARATTLAAFLEGHAGGFEPPRRPGRALLHGHCHHEAVLGGTSADAVLLRRSGLDVETPDTGCCGLAGSFGYDAAHHDVSVAAGERVLLPAVRALPPDALVVTDGFSCREQIAQLSGRRALHLAEVLAGVRGG